MVGIVLVSHSERIAQGILDLVSQMTQGQVPLAAAGGIDDPENPIGTDPMRVHDAINAVYSESGVIVLIDLGSALMSAEVAIEMLTPAQRQHVYLCPAPLVEGAMAASVQASVGADARQVFDEAMAAARAKREQLAPAVVEPRATNEAAQVDGTAQRLIFTVPNKLGLHARPAARLVGVANRYNAALRLRKTDDTRSIDAKSINQVVTLGVGQGDEIEVTATGVDAAQALAAIRALADDNFGDDDDIADDAPAPQADAPRPEAAPGQIIGTAASPGFAVGPVVQFRREIGEIEKRTAADVQAEQQRLKAAVDEAEREIQMTERQMIRKVGKKDAAIFEAHLLILKDPDLAQQARDRISRDSVTAEYAWSQAIKDLAQTYRAMDDAYIRARADDVVDVGQRVLRRLLGEAMTRFEISTPSIVIAETLNPSDTAQLNPSVVLGICTAGGGPTSHSAILARALGIPAVVGAGEGLLALTDGQVIGVEGEAGIIWTAPDEARQNALKQSAKTWQAEQKRMKQGAQALAATADGYRVEVAANIGGPYDAEVAVTYGAEGVGLFRTEFLFMERDEAPDEDEQVEAYSKVGAAMGDNPVIIRTLDIGGDKPVPYLAMGSEENPFLGWRGIRFTLAQPALFKTQLRAVLRAGAAHNLKLMFPMVSTVAELRAARKLLAEARDELKARGLPAAADLPVGIMIEVPSAVMIADQLARESAFFSIGTNDLTQYLMAADRGNAKVSDLADPLNPAVLRMVKRTVEAGQAARIPVHMCGELAGNPLAVPALVGLGLEELSMSAPSIPRVKQVIAAMSMVRAQEIAEQVVLLESAEEVRTYLKSVAP